MPNWLGSALVATTLAVLSVSPKIWLQRHSAQADDMRLNRDMAARLAAAGFQVTADPGLTIPAIRAARGNCRIIARNGDRARELRAIFDLEDAGYGPVAFGYRQHWTARPAGARAVMERFAQNGLARVGVDATRPAVVALATAGPCPGTRALLADLDAHSYLKEVVPQSED